MKIFIDDSRDGPDTSWTLARTITEAIHLLSQFEVEEISLDHDIECRFRMGENDIPHASPETFMAVAYYICEKYWVEKKDGELTMLARPSSIPKISIHSANTVGAENMRRLFMDYGIVATIKSAT